MPNKKVDSDGVVIDLVVNNSIYAPIRSEGVDFSNGKREHFHLVRKGEGVDIVSDGFVDEDELIQSEKCNAGLENIIRLQTLRYGTIQNAIKRNEDKQTFADVSEIPTDVAGQQQYIAKAEKDLEALCKELGVSKEELLKSNIDTLTELVNKKNASQNAASEGGNE